MHTTGDMQNLEFVKGHSSIIYFTNVAPYVMSFSMLCACNDNKKQWQWSNNRTQIKIIYWSIPMVFIVAALGK